jgi:hypothetical protein
VVIPDSVTIGSGVTSIGNQAFSWSTGLTSVTVLATTPPTLEYWVFNNTHASLQIFVPAGSVAAYQLAWGPELPAPGASRIVAIP